VIKKIPDALTPDQAWQILSSAFALSVESHPLADCLDHVLAEDFVAAQDVPFSPRSFMDGYAVRAEDTNQAPVRLKISGEVAMGEMPAAKLQPGQSFAIPTGGFLPDGASAVVMQEDASRTDDIVEIKRTVQKDENVQTTGEDFKRGEKIFEAGHRLRPQDLAVAGTFGTTHLKVRRRPRLAIFSTGNELIPFRKAESDPTKIRETNSLALQTAASKFGFRAQGFGIVPDDADSQHAALQKALKVSDVVLISGGSSVGARDYTIEVIRSFASSRILFHGLAIRPGNPTIFASIDSQWIFGLPGQPVSSLIVFYEFVLPFLFHLSGSVVDPNTFHELHFRTVSATINKTVKPLKIKTDYLRVKLQHSDKKWTAEPVTGKSASLSTLALADGFTIIPPGESPVEEGSQIQVFLFP
jgi:molybdopterin molybdotransferase